MSREALRSYRQRLNCLRALGFDDYDAYLASPLWRSIRLRKLEEFKRQCFGCGAEGCSQVHHADYSFETLTGNRPERLFVVCDACHEAAEFYGKSLKLGPREATERLREIRKKNRLTSA
jgi:hypothetical protein